MRRIESHMLAMKGSVCQEDANASDFGTGWLKEPQALPLGAGRTGFLTIQDLSHPPARSQADGRQPGAAPGISLGMGIGQNQAGMGVRIMPNASTQSLVWSSELRRCLMSFKSESLPSKEKTDNK